MKSLDQNKLIKSFNYIVSPTKYMQIPLNLALSYSNYTFAYITKCTVYNINQTFSKIELIFEFTIKPTDLIEGGNPSLNTIIIDLYFNDGQKNGYIGRFHRNSIEPSTLNYERNHQLRLLLSKESFMKLVDETHFKNLELKITVQGLLELDAIPKNSSGGSISNSRQIYVNGDGYLTFPHSEWAKILSSAKMERFDLITLRTALPEFPQENAFTQAFDKLKEAQDKFNRGDWNSVGTTCRAALRTIMSLKPKELKGQPIDYLLSAVTDEPKRKTFASSLKAVWDSICIATHLEGNSNEDLPPANLEREDALFCLHLTTAAIAYIATVHKI